MRQLRGEHLAGGGHCGGGLHSVHERVYGSGGCRDLGGIMLDQLRFGDACCDGERGVYGAGGGDWGNGVLGCGAYGGIGQHDAGKHDGGQHDGSDGESVSDELSECARECRCANFMLCGMRGRSGCGDCERGLRELQCGYFQGSGQCKLWQHRRLRELCGGPNGKYLYRGHQLRGVQDPEDGIGNRHSAARDDGEAHHAGDVRECQRNELLGYFGNLQRRQRHRDKGEFWRHIIQSDKLS